MKAIFLLMCGCMLLSGGGDALSATPPKHQKVAVMDRPKPEPKKHKKPVLPPVGRRIKHKPPRGVPFYYKNVPYFYANGLYYKDMGRLGYEVIRPVIGMMIPVLPGCHVRKVRVRNEIFFLYDGVLYKKRVTPRGVMFEVRGFL